MQYTCPIFNNFIFCASGFSESVRNELTELIESNGGVYSGDLVCGSTTHLVASEPKGKKFIHAKQWKVKVVTFAWITDSIKAKYCLDEKKYELEDPDGTTARVDDIGGNVDDRISDTNLVNNTNLASRNSNSSHNVSARFNTTPSLAKNMHQQQMSRQQKMLPPDMDISVINKNNSNKMMLNLSNNTTINQADGPNTSMLNSTTIGAVTPKTITKYPSILKELQSVMKTKLTLFDGVNVGFFSSFTFLTIYDLIAF